MQKSLDLVLKQNQAVRLLQKAKLLLFQFL